MRLYLTKAEANILLEALEALENSQEIPCEHIGLKQRIQRCMEQQKPLKKPT